MNRGTSASRLWRVASSGRINPTQYPKTYLTGARRTLSERLDKTLAAAYKNKPEFTMVSLPPTASSITSSSPPNPSHHLTSHPATGENHRQNSSSHTHTPSETHMSVWPCTHRDTRRSRRAGGTGSRAWSGVFWEVPTMDGAHGLSALHQTPSDHEERRTRRGED